MADGKDRRKSGSIWEDDAFEDISSYSRGTARRPDFREEYPRSQPPRERPRRQPRPREREWDIPQWEMERAPSRRERTSPERPRPRRDEERDAGRRRGKKPPRPGVRRAVVFFAVLLMAAVTLILAIELLFKINTIEVTGNGAEVYEAADILSVCGVDVGDNLVFLTTGDKERKLRERFPYIGEAKITRRLPDTLTIDVTLASAAGCVYTEDGWLLVSGGGKILEKQYAPPDDTLLVLGASPLQTEPGCQVELEDESAQSAYDAILSTAGSAGEEWILDGRFTLLDLSDLSHIVLYYEDRVEFQLGNVLDLKYKIDLGCRSLMEMEGNETGVMDLSYAGETKKAIFTAGEISVPSIPAAVSAPPEDDGEPASQPEGTSQPDEPSSSRPEAAEPASRSPRAEGIPDAPYTG